MELAQRKALLVGAVATALMSVTGTVIAQSGSESTDSVITDSKTTPEDKALAEQVYKALQDDPKHYYKHVNVRAEKGVVTLGGYVGTASGMNKAKEIASHCQGVTKVVNQMQLQREGERPSPEH